MTVEELEQILIEYEDKVQVRVFLPGGLQKDLGETIWVCDEDGCSIALEVLP